MIGGEPVATYMEVPSFAPKLKAHLASGAPALLNVDGGGHWILAFDYEEEGGQDYFKSLDPGRRAVDGYTLEELTCMRGVLIEPESRYRWLTSLSDRMPTAARTASVDDSGVDCFAEKAGVGDFLLISPSGKKVGRDPVTGVWYDEIAEGSYTIEYPILSPDFAWTPEEIVEMRPFLPRYAYLAAMEEGEYTIEIASDVDGEFSFMMNWGVDGEWEDLFSVEGAIVAGQEIAYVVMIPEPGALALLALGSLALFPHRRRP